MPTNPYSFQENEIQAPDRKKMPANNTSDKGLLPKVYKELLKVDNKETNNPI